MQRSESKTRPLWSGLWYANVGDGGSRSWEDMRKFGFLAAGGGRLYSDPLRRLRVGDLLYAYQKGRGYVGYGRVRAEVVQAADSRVDGKSLLEQELRQPNLAHDLNDPDRTEYVVGMAWEKTFGLDEAKTFPGAFANQNIVCKLRDPKTIEFLKREFGQDWP